MTKPVPEGYHTVTPYLIIDNAREAIEYYRQLFGAEEIMRMEAPDGKIMHADLRIGDSRIFISDEFPGGECKSPRSLGAATALVFLYVEDVDRLVERARDAGARVTDKPEDTFWGDRYSQFTDPFGLCWAVSTHIEDVSSDEVQRRCREFMASMGGQA